MFRFANENDVALILQFIRELADYEKMLEYAKANLPEESCGLIAGKE